MSNGLFFFFLGLYRHFMSVFLENGFLFSEKACRFSVLSSKKCSFFQKIFVVWLYAVIFADIICFYKK